jgi:hypothetical protein
MRLRRSVAAAALLGATSLAAPARAQHFDGRASLTAGVTYNQTLTDAPYPTALTTAGPSVTLGPSAVLIYDTPLTNNTLTYSLTVGVPFTKQLQTNASSINYTNRLAYSGRFTLSELSTMTATLAVNHSPLHTLGIGADPSQAAADPVPAGAAYLLGVQAGEGFNRQLSQQLSLTQAASFTFNAPFDPLVISARTIGGQLSLGLNKQFDADTLGIQLAAAATYFTAGETAGGGVTDPTLQMTNSLQLTYSRPLTELLTLAISAGASQVVNLSQPTPTAVQPTGTLAITYHLDLATATLNYAHMAAPNLATNSVNFTDSGTLRFSMPLGQTGLTGTGSAGITHTTPIGTGGEQTNVIMSDLSLVWRPISVPTLSLTARGQVQRQVGGGDVNGGFTRITTSLNLTYSYPSSNAAQLVPSMAPPVGALPYLTNDPTSTNRRFEGADAPPEAPAQPGTPSAPPAP